MTYQEQYRKGLEKMYQLGFEHGKDIAKKEFVIELLRTQENELYLRRYYAGK